MDRVDSWVAVTHFIRGCLTGTMASIDGLVQDCSSSSALAMELLKSCTKPSICASERVLIGLDYGYT